MTLPEADDEVLPTGPGLPRWLPWLAGTVVVVVGIVALLSRLPSGHGSAGPTAPAPSASAPRHSAVAPAPGPTPIATGPALTLPGGEPALAIAVVGDEAWLLQGNLLSTFTTDANYRSRPVSGLTFGGSRPPSLLVDSAAHRVWVTVFNAPGPTVHGYDSETLARVVTYHQQAPLFSAAPLNGALIYSDGFGTHRLTSDAAPTRFADAARNTVLTADPSRSRVLSLQPGTHPVLEVIRPGAPLRRLSLRPSLVSGALAVTGSGAIWLGGYGEQGGVLVRLDPVTFRPMLNSLIGYEAGSGVQILATGTDDLLIGTGEVPNELACMSASDGRSEQTWPILTENAAVTRGTGYALVGGDVVPLELHGGCTG